MFTLDQADYVWEEQKHTLCDGVKLFFFVKEITTCLVDAQKQYCSKIKAMGPLCFRLLVYYSQ